MKTIHVKLNGEQREIEVEEKWTLLYLIREVLGLTGTKCGCKTGDCGTCTVIVDEEAVRSCLVKACHMDGKVIETIEGVADGETLHPIQQAFIDEGAVQCGFCTPGMVMRAKALLDKNPSPTEEEVRLAIDPSICRCGGYEKIVTAILVAAERMRGETE